MKVNGHISKLKVVKNSMSEQNNLFSFLFYKLLSMKVNGPISESFLVNNIQSTFHPEMHQL